VTLARFEKDAPHAWMRRRRGEIEWQSEWDEREAFSPSDARARIAEIVASGPPKEDDDAWDAVEGQLPLLDAAAPEMIDELVSMMARSNDDVYDEDWIADVQARRRTPRGASDRLLVWDEYHDAWSLDQVLEAVDAGRLDEESDARDQSDAEFLVVRLGLLGERAVASLRRLRDDRARKLYWAATAGLAIAGDTDAREECLALLGDDRTFFYDGCVGDRVLLGLNGDADALSYWRSRIGTNCCLWFHADQMLSHGWYPTMPSDNRGDDIGAVAHAAAWWARWKGSLRWSRIADGWVPVKSDD